MALKNRMLVFFRAEFFSQSLFFSDYSLLLWLGEVMMLAVRELGLGLLCIGVVICVCASMCVEENARI